MKRKYIILLLIISVLLVAVVGIGAYAFLLPKTQITNLEINSSVSSPLSFSTTGGNNLSVVVSYDKMADGNIGNVAITTDDVISITLESDGLEEICCSYDINWVWALDSYNYIKTSSDDNEYTIEITGTGKNLVAPNEYETFTYANAIYPENQIPNYNENNLTNKLTTAHICNNDNLLSSEVIQNLNIKTRIYNLAQNQEHLKTANLSGKVTITNVSCY